MTDAELDKRTDARHAAKLRRIAGVLRSLLGVCAGAVNEELQQAADLLEGYAAEPLHKPDLRQAVIAECAKVAKDHADVFRLRSRQADKRSREHSNLTMAANAVRYVEGDIRALATERGQS
jgi:hypothetical protein